MKPLIVLLISFLCTCIIFKLKGKRINYGSAGRIAMASMLTFTSIGHFIYTEGMESMIPEIIPFRHQITLVTGILELAFALGILLSEKRRIVGIFLIAFFVCILPANIHAAMENMNYVTGEPDGPGVSYLWFRIPLQLFFILWVYRFVIFDPAHAKQIRSRGV